MTLSPARVARLKISLRLWFATWRAGRATIGPLADLAIRLIVGQTFLMSGLVKAMDWQSALYLARYEYPLTWITPEHAAALGLIIELLCPILLILGLMTRATSLPMAILAIVIHTTYRTLDTNLFWAAILFGYVLFGAGPISVDALVRGGLRDSALPLASRIIGAMERISRHACPLYELLVRLWFGWALLGLPADGRFFPVTSVHDWVAAPIALATGSAFILGLGIPVAAILLATASVGTGMMMAGPQETIWMTLLLVQIAARGNGTWSVDNHIGALLGAWAKSPRGVAGHWPRIVVIGAGFGGMACVQKLRHLPVHITLIDRHNYHLFQPLLYQVATAGLSPADIASPIRSQFRDDANVRVIMGEVVGIDSERKLVRFGDQALAYDRLVIATGASHSYFGRDEWAGFAPGLKRIEDATAVRAKLLSGFERAETAEDPAEREALLTFVIVGAGPTGVELAGSIAELARFGLQEEFRDIDPSAARIVLVQSGPRILPSFPPSLSERAQKALEMLGVEVRTNSRVRDIDDHGVMIDEARIHAATVLWAAGVVASPAARWLNRPGDRAGRVPVDPYLRVAGQSDIFAIGDTAATIDATGQTVPGLAPAAKQAGEYVAALIRAGIEGRDDHAPFRYRHQGSLATIGRKAAIADFGRFRLWGAPAWWLWGAIHVLFLSGFRNRASVITSWMWAYLTFRSGTRLITGRTG